MTKQKALSRGDFKQLVIERIKNFWGYGNLKGKVWFVGMEEGYNDKNENLEGRFNATKGGQVFDIYENLKMDPGHVSWFEEGAPTQATYRRLIYLYLYIKNKIEPNIEDIREFQIHNLGRRLSDNALLELMPLPSKSLSEKHWLYKDFGVEGLSSKREYLTTYKPKRVKELNLLIRNNKPKIVIFYSLTYMKDWVSVIETPLTKIITKKLYMAKNNDTLFFIVPHSTSRGMTNNDWNNIAKNIILHL